MRELRAANYGGCAAFLPLPLSDGWWRSAILCGLSCPRCTRRASEIRGGFGTVILGASTNERDGGCAALDVRVVRDTFVFFVFFLLRA